MIPDSNEARIEVSTLCNYNCIICPHDSMTRKKEVMSTRLFRKILDKLPDQYDTLTFSGIGEPLMNPDINNMVAWANRSGFRTLLLTNGYLLTPARLDHLINLGLDSVRVSFYGVRMKTYAMAHGCSEEWGFVAHDNVANALGKIDIVLTFNVIPGVNDEEMERWSESWRGAKQEIWHPHNWVYGRTYREVQSEKVNTCGRPFNGPLQIQVDGTVIMCCFDYEGKLELGDLKTHSLEEVFDTFPFKMIVANHERNIHMGMICQHCDQRNASKDDVMIFSSEHDLKERVTLTSTCYKKVGG
jgi:hypothetical protein